tara:strand:- start:273 stop:782 length:510 start_codon:yes stop_codon:yes gene_type:complete
MELNTENKLNFGEKLLNFYNLNKVKIFTLLIVILLVVTFLIFLKHQKKKNNTLITEKYVKAGIYLSAKKNNEAKKLYEEIIISRNKIYSILALNTVIEKNLILDENKILEYFSIVEKSISNKDQKDLIILKKALYQINENKKEEGNKLLKKLINDNSSLKTIAQEILSD